MKHYGKFLAYAGNPIKYKSDDIERLYMRKERLENELKQITYQIKEEERDFEKLIKDDWDSEEIEQAKIKAQNL